MRKGSIKGSQFIEFHYTYLIVALGFILTGYYLNLIVFTSLILVHEMGHYFVARLFSFHVEKIVIYPYGGMTKIRDLVNRNIYEELLIASSGVMVQFLFYLVICFLHQYSFIRDYTMNLYTLYNNQMIFFNLLPIYPLDGAKILNLLLSNYFYFNLSNLLTVMISIFMILGIMIFDFYRCNYSDIMVMGILVTYIYRFFKERKYLYQRFLLERYLYSIYYPSVAITNSEKKMFKNKMHLFYIHHSYRKEKDYLKDFFCQK